TFRVTTTAFSAVSSREMPGDEESPPRLFRNAKTRAAVTMANAAAISSTPRFLLDSAVAAEEIVRATCLLLTRTIGRLPESQSPNSKALTCQPTYARTAVVRGAAEACRQDWAAVEP